MRPALGIVVLYNAFFNLNEQPFNLTPDPKFIYLSSMHQEALMHMLYGVEEKKGFMLITGPIGTGKTTLTRALLEQVEGRAAVALITNTCSMTSNCSRPLLWNSVCP